VRRYLFAVLVALLAVLPSCEVVRIDPLPPGPGPSPVDPVGPKPPVVDPVDPNVPAPPAATWEAALKVQAGLTVAQVREALGVDPAYSSADATTGNVVSDFRIVDDQGRKQYLSVTFTNGVVSGRVRIPRAR